MQNIIERAFITTTEEKIPRNTWEKLIKIPGQQGIFDETKSESMRISLKNKLEELEKAIIEAYLPHYENSRQFAELLGIDKSTVNRKLKKYGLISRVRSDNESIKEAIAGASKRQKTP